MARQQIDILYELGITQWRLRNPVAQPVSTRADAAIEKPLTTATRAAAPVVARPEPTAKLVVPHAVSLAVEDVSSKVGSKDWATLDLEFTQRSHCGENPKLMALPPVERRRARCAVVVPAPSDHDLAQQQIQSDSAQCLLNEILRAVGIEDHDTYQTNALKCAGPGLNDEPCSVWVQSELELVAPQLCIVFGEQAARIVLKTNDALNVLRQAPQAHPFLPIRCFVTHALDAMLGQPELKRECWQDLKPVAQFLADNNSGELLEPRVPPKPPVL